MRALAPPPQPAPSGPRQKQWYDRLADALLGEDDSVTSSPKNQYALICAKCFKHNGLVRENMWESARESTLMDLILKETDLSGQRICLPSLRSL